MAVTAEQNHKPMSIRAGRQPEFLYGLFRNPLEGSNTNLFVVDNDLYICTYIWTKLTRCP